MGPDDTLATALYVRIDDLLAQNPHWAPERPVVGFAPKLSDAELVTLAVISALLGYDNESQFVRYAKAHLRPWFPYLPNRDGYNKRLRRSGEMIARVMGWLARECESWHHDVWLVDSTPVECGTSRETRKRSDLAGWAEYGYCASHSRWFWGLRLHLVATPAGLPIAFAWTTSLRGTDGNVVAFTYLHSYFDDCLSLCGLELTYLISVETGEVLTCGVEPRYSEFAFVAPADAAPLSSSAVLPPSGWLDPAPCLRGLLADGFGCSILVHESEPDTRCVREFDLGSAVEGIAGAEVTPALRGSS